MEIVTPDKTSEAPHSPTEMTTSKPTTEAPHWTNHVRFNGDGYLDINIKLLDYQERRQLEIKIVLSTIESEGLLLWQGQNDEEVKNYMAVGIREGKVKIFENRFLQYLEFLPSDKRKRGLI